MKTDVFSFALILYDIVTAQSYDFDKNHANPVEIRKRLLDAETPQLQFEGTADFMLKIIARGLSANPTDRPSIEEIVDEFEENEYAMIAGVDRCAISEFVMWAESPQSLA
jgi:hypothetical protein